MTNYTELEVLDSIESRIQLEEHLRNETQEDKARELVAAIGVIINPDWLSYPVHATDLGFSEEELESMAGNGPMAKTFCCSSNTLGGAHCC